MLLCLRNKCKDSLKIYKQIRSSSGFVFKDGEDRDENLEPTRPLKKWRNLPEYPEPALKVLNIHGNKDSFFYPNRLGLIKPAEFPHWWKLQVIKAEKHAQRFILERHQILGNELATAHFLLNRGGKVRLKDSDEFLTEEDLENLPGKFVPDWVLEEIDASDTDIRYEGIENIRQLAGLKIAHFRNCIHFDDWCLERLLSQCKTLEYLDISDCENVTERGLEGLYRTWNLKRLIVTNHHKSAAFELTCMMVEDVVPELTIEIRMPSEKKEAEQ